MLEWFADRVTVYRSRGLGWRIIAGVLVGVAVLVAIAVIAWRRREEARRAHDAFTAQVDARALEDDARRERDDGKVTNLRERAAEAQARSDLAEERAREARKQHVQALDAIDRVRDWSDVRPRGR